MNIGKQNTGMIFTSSMNTSTEAFITMLLFLSFLISISMICQASDTITTTQFITDNQTIVSSGGSFEMGFFSPGSSNNWYLGIWYKKITTRTVVWVANREILIMNPSGVIKIFNSGILVLLNKTTGKIIWSTNTSRSVQNPVAQLLESGNLVVKEANDDNPDNFLWQSFDYPCDTLLPVYSTISKASYEGKKGEKIGISLALSMGLGLLICCLIFHVWRKKQQQQTKRKGTMRDIFKQGGNNESQKKDLELPLFDLATIMNATSNFSASNKLGEGGFGTVYKGTLEEGQQIAVKRLSRNSRQGIDEFKNEVICIAKLQHRNLVKLLGCCIQGEEKMLIYEYMPNKSLDFFIFGLALSKP